VDADILPRADRFHTKGNGVFPQNGLKKPSQLFIPARPNLAGGIGIGEGNEAPRLTPGEVPIG
jgi:hypothetical protein